MYRSEVSVFVPFIFMSLSACNTSVNLRLISSPRRTPVNKLYAIWNFLKHNSLSTYEALKNSYPEAIIEVNRKYTQGEFALFYINFDETLINTLLTELKEFFIEYCNLVFGENFESTQWNYNDWFIEKVNDEIEVFTNPLGLSPWI